MIWLTQISVVLAILIYLFEYLRRAQLLSNAGLWVPVLLIASMLHFGAFVWTRETLNCQTHLPSLDDDFNAKHPADQLAVLRALQADVSKHLARCRGEEIQHWNMYLRLGEMIEVMDAAKTQTELDAVSGQPN